MACGYGVFALLTSHKPSCEQKSQTIYFWHKLLPLTDQDMPWDYKTSQE